VAAPLGGGRVELRKLAAYYRDVLTLLAENSGRALRNLRVGRNYGLVADLSAFGLPFKRYLEDDAVTISNIVPPIPVQGTLFPSEPETPEAAGEPPVNTNEHDLGDEGVALVRIWRKQRQDPYNRETLLGLGILRASAGTKTFFGPVLYYRVNSLW